ncbi:hypothetical protein [Nitrospirillum viridazoti]|nr:hypothetical protein [Nitrospirillum amazonense]
MGAMVEKMREMREIGCEMLPTHLSIFLRAMMIAGRRVGMVAALVMAAGCVQRTQVTPVTLTTGAGVAKPPMTAVPARMSLNKTVPAGEDRQIDFYVSLHEDCSAIPGIVVRILTPPSHGTANVREGKGYSSFAATSSRAACNKSPSTGQQLWYQPAPGYTGVDVMELQIFWPMGQSQTLTYTLSVQGGANQPAPPAPAGT